METSKTARITEKSQAAFKAAQRLIPGGASLPGGADQSGGADQPGAETPLYLAKGNGAILFDADGNEYLDYDGGGGTLILGQADERIVVAINKAVTRGSCFDCATEGEIKLAELIASRLPSVEMVRLFSAHAEATLAALQLVRHATERPGILAFTGHYHGGIPGIDTALDSVGAGAPGLPQAPFNDLPAVTKLVEQHGSEVAALLLEPIMGHRGLVLPAEGFLAGLRELCTKHGALLIFDETLTGFRVAAGGAAALYKVKPDLAILGGVMGGGLPLAGLGGRKELMNTLPKLLSTCSAALPGLPLATAAGIATLQALSETGTYDDLENLTEQLVTGLQQVAEQTGFPLTTACAGSMFRLNAGEAADSDPGPYQARFRQALLERGVYLPAVPSACAFVSAAHTTEHVERTLEVARDAMTSVLEEGS